MVYRGCYSDWVSVTTGVPQESVLGPLLLLVYINDQDGSIINALFKFADDSKSVNSVGCDQDFDVAQNNLNALAAWSNDWQMPFNADKCKVIA